MKKGNRLEDKKRERKLKILTYIQIGLMMFLSVVLLFPFVKNYQFNARIKTEINDFRSQDRTEQVEQMVQINEEIHEKDNFYTTDPFHEQVRYADRAEMLGVLEIPKIDEELTVYDRTDSLSLREGVGLLEGTHLPTGGIGNTTVLTGHDGMAEATIFRNLDKLEDGDVFTFDNGVEVLTYEVYDTITVEPHETDYIQQIPDQDTMILLTCDTPDLMKGLNTHRVLVYGKRIPTETVPEIKEGKVASSKLRYQVFGAIGLGVLGIAVYQGFKYKKDKKEDDEK